jgi:hypothetical protein
MSLEAARQHTAVALRHAAPLTEVVQLARRWFDELKEWEKNESWDRAFTDGRMTMRMAPKTDTRDIPKLPPARVGADSLKEKTNPTFFMRKLKNQFGLHDVSAVLLKPNLKLSKQYFTKKVEHAIFAPIPLEEDMILFEELSAASKRQKKGDLYEFIRLARASFTRLQYASAVDMAVTYQVEIREGKEHVRYGHATKVGKEDPRPVMPELLAVRRWDAMHYKTKILQAEAKVANNEVTIKYRQHAGVFPWIGSPDGNDGWIVGFTSLAGTVTDDGKFIPAR